MNLGFYYHIPAIKNEERILIPGYLGRFLDSLAQHFSKLSLFLHVPNPGENVKFDYCIQADNVELISLPQRRSAPYRILHSRKYANVIKRQLSGLDCFMLRGPTPLLPSLAKITCVHPTILMIVGDYLAGVASLPQPGWRKALIRALGLYNYRGQLKAAKQSLVFVNSQIFLTHYKGKAKKLAQTRTTTLTKDDFFSREDTCLNRPIHLLYTGRMDPAKGLLDMIKAVAILTGGGEDVILDLVGWPVKGSNILELINSVANEEKVSGRVVYHGYKAVGPELFAYYKNADIYLTASQASEGFPRTIWEAMAHSLPVVATKVGSIPYFINGAAGLVEPRNPASLADGIKTLIDNKELRKGYIKQGFVMARENTLEVQVSEMARQIHLWVDGEK